MCVSESRESMSSRSLPSVVVKTELEYAQAGVLTKQGLHVLQQPI